MFTDVLNMIIHCISNVINSLSSATVSFRGHPVSLFTILLCFCLLSMLFTFFLVPRAGSGLGGIRNVSTYIQSERRKNNDSKGDK